MLCGDIESNPGPDIQEILDKVLEGQKEILKSISVINSEQTAQRATLTAVLQKVSNLETLLDTMNKSTCRIDNFDTSLNVLKTSVADQSEKIVDIEYRSRRSNLIVFGLIEKPNETEDVLRKEVVDELFCKKLNVSCSSIGRIHRLGRQAGNRPVIMYLQDFTEKQEILKNAKKLKGTEIYIQNDYSRCTLRRRKLLWDSGKIDKANGKKPYLVHDKLRIDDETFMWDDSKNMRVKVLTVPKPAPASSTSQPPVSA